MNIVLIIFDSLRKDCISSLGTPPWGRVNTPKLDEFSKQSITLIRCYPESLPTLQARRAIYTGKRVYPFRNDIRYRGDFLGAPGWGPISEDRITLSEILQQNGYTTALISDIQHMFKPSKNFHRGFDEWHWIRGYEADAFRTGPRPSKKEIDYWLPKSLQNEIYLKFISQCIMNIKPFLQQEDEYPVARVMREAIRWLRENRNIKKKFLLIESWTPHEPWFVPDKYRFMYCKEDLPQQVMSIYDDVDNLEPKILKATQVNYSGLITMMDRWFGVLYEGISDLGMLDNTLIVVTSDHGHSIGESGYLGKRGYPSTPEVFDIPIIIRHPNHDYGRGIKSNILVQHTDIPATILDIANAKIMSDEYYYKWDNWVNQVFGDDKKTEKIASSSSADSINMHGKSFFKSLIHRKNKFRDYLVVAWGSAVTVINDQWWFNCKINRKGPFLYDLRSRNPFDTNVASSNPEVINYLFNLAIDEAEGRIPEYLIELADKNMDAPGCSNLVAR